MKRFLRLVGGAAAGGRLWRWVWGWGGVGARSGSIGRRLRCIGGCHGPTLHDVHACGARERCHRDGGQEEHDEEHTCTSHYSDDSCLLFLYVLWLCFDCDDGTGEARCLYIGNMNVVWLFLGEVVALRRANASSSCPMVVHYPRTEEVLDAQVSLYIGGQTCECS